MGCSSPYVGGRMVLGYSFGPRFNYLLGVAGMLDEDLDRQTKSVTYESRDWLFGGAPTKMHSEHVVGQTTYGVHIVFGREFDLSRY